MPGNPHRQRRLRNRKEMSILFLVLIVLTFGIILARPIHAQSTDGPIIGISLGDSVSCAAHSKIGYTRSTYGNEPNLPWVSCVENKNVVPRSDFEPISNTIHPFRVSDHSHRGAAHDINGETSNISTQYLPDSEATATIIKHLAALASDHLNTTVGNVIIAVPSWFNDEQRQAVKACGTQAGLEVLRVINEPTAARLVYGLYEPHGISEADERFSLVVDMGDTTFDVTALSIEEGVFEILGTAGNLGLGGNNVNKMWSDHVLDVIKKQTGLDLQGNLNITEELKAEIEESKRLLYTQRSGIVSLTASYQEGIFNNTLTQADFDYLVTLLLEQVIDTINYAIESAQLVKSNFTEVVLVTESTNIPLLKTIINKYFSTENVPIRIMSSINGTEIVAIGAAIQGASISEDVYGGCLLGFNINALSMGVETAGRLMYPIVKRGTALPTKKTYFFTTVTDEQDSIVIKVFRGERIFTYDNTYLGQLPPLPVSKGARGTVKVEVSIEMDYREEIVKISGLEPKTDANVSLVLNMTDFGILREEEIDKMVEESWVYLEEEEDAKGLVQAVVQANIADDKGRIAGEETWDFVEWKQEERIHDEL